MSSLFLAALCVAVRAHNWVNSPSRSEFASTVNPALPSQTGLPHVKVIANQDIQVEWVNGHDSDCYWVLTAEQDSFKNLVKTNTRVLDDFINNAPANQQVPPPARWQKYHRKYDNFNLDNKAGDAFFQAVIKPTDNSANYMVRPDVFEGRFAGVRGGKGADANESLVYQMVYKSGTSCTDNDRRVQYKNAQYPWIIAVHRYRLCTGQASRPDVARLTFPAGTAPGRYVAQWTWRGYYDIVDVEIVAGATPVAKPYGKKIPLPPAGIPAQYRRVDHCVFPDATPAGMCYRIVTDARGCMQMCDRLTELGCHGVAIVPVLHPAGAYQGFKNVSFMPYSFTSTCRQRDIERSANANHFACFAATARPKTDTVDQFYVTNDPQDPAFYSSCMIRIPYRQSMDGPVPTPARTPTWEFNGECVSCEDAKISTYEQAIMQWKPVKTCANCDVERAVAVPPAQVPPIFPLLAPWKARFPKKYCAGFNKNSMSPNNVCANGTSCAVSLRPAGANNADISESDCYALAKSDKRCGKHVLQRPVGGENPTLCICWRGDGGDTPCCGVCSMSNSQSYITYEI
jgi:hypothetical protein